MNKKTTKINIYSTKPTSIKFNNKTYNFFGESQIFPERNNDTLIIIAKSDSLERTIKLKARNSFFYYANAYYLGVGFFIDHNNPKRYTYQKHAYIDCNSKKTKPHRFAPVNKNSVYLNISLPWINNFYLHPQNETFKSNTGFNGISGGLDYYYKENKFINISANGIMDFLVPFPAIVDFSGEVDFMTSLYFSITNNIVLDGFILGYGLNYSINTWEHRYFKWLDDPPPKRDPVLKTDESCGITTNAYYRFSKHFYIGMIYRPSFVCISPTTKFNYEHIISIDFLWKLRLLK